MAGLIFQASFGPVCDAVRSSKRHLAVCERKKRPQSGLLPPCDIMSFARTSLSDLRLLSTPARLASGRERRNAFGHRALAVPPPRRSFMPADEKMPPDAMYFRSLALENVRAFASPQLLEFVDENGAISRWNLILGENGVGKTTLMRALADMWPVPAYKSPSDTAPTLAMPELSEHEDNDDFMDYIRRDGPGTATLEAILETEAGKRVKVGVTITGTTEKLEDVKCHEVFFELPGGGPLVIGYGAARHLGNRNLAEMAERKATDSLFNKGALDLFDAQEIIETLDHGKKSDDGSEIGSDAWRLKTIKPVIASLLPGGLTADDIDIRGPRISGRNPERSGIYVRTPSGMTPFADLSLGYQTMFALIVDLGWRLFNAFPKSPSPLSESAIVLIDEVDLHLHPKWQRDLPPLFLKHFPKVQFIVSTHSPITAQEALSESVEGNVAVVRWEGNEAQISNDPVPRGEWRSDQLLVSDLFELGSDRSRQAEKKLHERIVLSRTLNRSAEQEARLRDLDEFVASLPTASSPSAQSLEELIMRLAKEYPSGAAR